jgi:hypothetical protein
MFIIYVQLVFLLRENDISFLTIKLNVPFNL